jgi:hypothetical protein
MRAAGSGRGAASGQARGQANGAAGGLAHATISGAFDDTATGRAAARPACPAWRAAWAMAIAPELGTRGLEALRAALAADSEELVQQATTDPPDITLVTEGRGVLIDPHTEPVRAADPLAYVLWRGLEWPAGGPTVHGLTAAWGSLVRSAAAALAASGLAGVDLADFFRFWDNSGRPEAVGGLLEAVEAELASRKAGALFREAVAARPEEVPALPSPALAGPWASGLAGILAWRQSLSAGHAAAVAASSAPPRPPRPSPPPAPPGPRRPVRRSGG